MLAVQAAGYQAVLAKVKESAARNGNLYGEAKITEDIQSQLDANLKEREELQAQIKSDQ